MTQPNFPLTSYFLFYFYFLIILHCLPQWGFSLRIYKWVESPFKFSDYHTYGPHSKPNIQILTTISKNTYVYLYLLLIFHLLQILWFFDSSSILHPLPLLMSSFFFTSLPLSSSSSSSSCFLSYSSSSFILFSQSSTTSPLFFS